MSSQALNEIRRLRRGRANRLDLTRRTLYPTSMDDVSKSSDNNIPRQRHRNMTLDSSDIHSTTSTSSSMNAGKHESLKSSLMEANYLEMKSLGFIPSIRRGFGHHKNHKTNNEKNGHYKTDGDLKEKKEYGDEEEYNLEEEWGCIPGKDAMSKQRREYLWICLGVM